MIAERLVERGPHNRFQRTSGSGHAEARCYRDANEHLTEAGFPVLCVDCTTRPAEQSGQALRRFPELRELVTLRQPDS